MTITSQSTMEFHKENDRMKEMVFSKMEKLIRQMSDPNNGVQVRTQKHYLKPIPKAFTANDLISWLMMKLQIQEESEAQHLASLLCHYGYIFPITDSKSLSVKEDGAFYRFQCSYYWPKSHTPPNNEAYAIHLTKRSKRNKQKHGLEEYEQTALSKLKAMYHEQWDTINMQAEDQVRLAKGKNRCDKEISDSQERAYWRLHKPPPGQVKYFDECSKRNFSPSQIESRQKNVEFLRRQVDYLSLALDKPRLKTSKVIDNYVSRVQQYHDFDPFLSQPQPSNPWISDDTTIWTASANCDQPTEKRVKMWSFSLHELLSDKAGLRCFESFLKKEFSHENIRFWLSCKELKSCPQSQVPQKVDGIFKEFLASGAPCEINIDCKTMEEVQQNLKKKLSRYTFEPAESHIYTLMKKDSYARFLRSEEYKYLLATAVQPTGKKKPHLDFKTVVGITRFFSFTTNKKRTPTPSPRLKRRGSTSSDHSELGIGTPGTPCHSYSTGNLKELGENTAAYNSGPSAAGAARMSLPPVLTQSCSQRKCLDVPRPSFSGLSSGGDGSDEDLANCLVLSVPSKLNVVAPWEDPD